MHKPLIFHVDVNSAFLSWEAAERLKNGDSVDLRTIASAVGGDRETRHGIILAKSPLAKKAGVRTAEPIAQALKKCPELVVIPPSHGLYHRRSQEFMAVLARFAPDYEQYSVDEAFLDMTGTETLYGPPVEAAMLIRDTITAELGFTVNIGISTNKLLAKMASDFDKPNKIHTLFPEEIPEKMWPLPVDDLFFAGHAAAAKLHQLGIHTIGQLAHTDLPLLRTHLKSQGELLYEYANGRDSSPLTRAEPDNKGYGHSTTTAHDVTSAEEAKAILLSLCDSVCRRLRRDEVHAGCVAVQLTTADFVNRSHQRTLPTATNVTAEVYTIACSLFDKLWDGSPLRLLGVSTSHVTADQNRQYNLFDMDKYDRQGKLDQAMDQIRSRFGDGAVKRACFLQPETKPPSPGADTPPHGRDPDTK